MANATVILIAFVFSGGIVSLLLSIGQLVVRNRNRGNRILFYIYGAISLQLFHVVLVAFPDIPTLLPHIARAGALTRWVLGPLLLIFFREVLLEKSNANRTIHFIPPLVMLIAGLPFFTWDILSLFFNTWACPFCDGNTFYYISSAYTLGADVALLLYLIPLTYYVYRNKSDLPSGRNVLRTTTVILVIAIGAILCNIFFFFTSDTVFERQGAIFLTGVSYCNFLLGYVYPEVLHIMRVEAYEEKRAPSPLKAFDTKVLHQKLETLMREEKLYCDEDLQIKTVAEAMELRPNQLTYLLNHVYEKNFASFVNEFRVNEAKRMLLEETDRTVLSIGFAVGFNSKAAFYRAFQGFTGKTPQNYRKKEK